MTSGQPTIPGTDELRDLYAYPEELDAPWVRVNFIASLDGATHVEGSSTGLGTPADRRVFGVLRELADVVLVGAGTARAEDYGGARTNEARRAWRLEHGLAAVPPIAVVSAGARIDPASRLFTDTTVPPIVFTTETAFAADKQRLVDAGATVLELGHDSVDAAAILATLERLGLRRVLCEGGPKLFGALLDGEAVDDLCLTVSPLLVGGPAGRIVVTPNAFTYPMARAHVLADDDGTLLTRWVSTRPRG